MKGKIIFLLVINLIFIIQLSSQCPNRDSIYKSILHSRTAPDFSSSREFDVLLGYLNKIDQCPYKNDSVHVSLLRIVSYYYFRKSDFINAAKYYRRAIDILRANYNKPDIDYTLIVPSYYWLALFYDSLNNEKGKRIAIDSCSYLGMQLKVIDRSSLSAVISQIEYYYDAGEYRRCIDYAKKCEILSWQYANSKKGTTEFEAGEQYAFASYHWWIEALLRLEDYQTVERMLSNKLTEYENAGLKKYIGITYDQLAQVEMHKGDYLAALSYLRKSLKIENAVRNYFNAKQELNSIANLYYRHLGDNKTALVYFRKAINDNKGKISSFKDSVESLNIYNRTANVYVRMNLFDSAFRYFQLSLKQLKSVNNEEDLLRVSTDDIIRMKKIHYLTNLLIDKAYAYQQKFKLQGMKVDLNQAINLYKISDQFLEIVKSRLFELESKLFWRRDARRLYDNAILTCYMGNKVNDAFYFFEKSRAVLLNDQLNEQRWLNQDDILRQNQLKKNIQQLKRLQDALPASSREYFQIQDQIFDNNQQLQKLQDQIKANNPLYYQSFVDKNLISIEDVRNKILKDHEGLVELFAGDSAVYLLAITKQDTYFKKIDKHLYDSLGDRFRSYLAKSTLRTTVYDEFTSIANQLYHLIFDNVNLPAGRLIISPDGKYFPFEALIINPRNHHYFLDDYAVSYTYSARYLVNNFRQNSNSASYSFFGIAPVEFSHGHTTLSGSDQSLLKMKNYFSNATMLMHKEASKNNFLSQFTKYGIIQLYTHATDSGANGEPAIYFADTSLALSDLFYGSKPVTKLIVLSACETALGKVQTGEGVFSFNRGFAALGIPSAISNLWKVENEATYQLTELFYKYLGNGDPPDVALQKAKKEFMPRNQLPFYWAAPILVGQSEKIPMQTSSLLWLLPIGLLLAFTFWLDRKSFK